MPLEDRIRSSVETALGELTARVDHDMRAIVAELVKVATEDRNEAVAALQRDTAEQATADTRRQIEAAEARLRGTKGEAVNEARRDERARAASEMQRLLESVRGLDAATSLGEVLDVLGDSARREVSRAAVVVARNGRLMGWKLRGFGDMDTQPRTIDMSLDESGVIGLAVASARPATTRDSDGASAGPGFVPLPADRMGLAVPLIVGGRAVAVVYADSVATAGPEHAVPRVWPEVIELLARHAARCLEALTVQKTASPQSPRFWVPGATRSTAADETAGKRVTERASPREVSPPGVLT